jgi:hypothetical protein
MPSEASLETALAFGKIAPVAGDIAGREFLAISASIASSSPLTWNSLAIVETDRVERIERDQRSISSAEAAAAQRPEFLEHERRGDDGRPGIEGEAVLAELRRPSSGFIKLLENSDAVAARAEPDGSGKPAEAGADDDGMGTGIVDFGHRQADGSWTVIMAVAPGSLRLCPDRQAIHASYATDRSCGTCRARGLYEVEDALRITS